jgi:hypothetical protein
LTFLGLLLCLFPAVSCEKEGLRITAYRGVEGTQVDISSSRTLTVSDCGPENINLFVGSDGILTRYLVGSLNPWFDATCTDVLERGHYRYFFAEDDAMWFFNLECNCSGQ